MKYENETIVIFGILENKFCCQHTYYVKKTVQRVIIPDAYLVILLLLQIKNANYSNKVENAKFIFEVVRPVRCFCFFCTEKASGSEYSTCCDQP